jgi:hypothetical protein
MLLSFADYFRCHVAYEGLSKGSVAKIGSSGNKGTLHQKRRPELFS